MYVIIYSLDATRCVILHLAASQSLQHALGPASPPLWQCGLVVLGLAGIIVQVRFHQGCDCGWLGDQGASSAASRACA